MSNLLNNKVNIKIDNKLIKTNYNKTIIQAILSNNLDIEIPRFCFHEKLSIAGNCRMCLVELEKAPKPIVSCAMQVSDGMIIKTNTSLIKKAREGVLEFLLINHPLDCPICDQGGECDLQDQAMLFGGDKGRFYEYKRSTKNKDCSPFIETYMTRCIHCTRCVRFMVEIAGISTLGVLGRGNNMEIGTYLDKKLLNSELSGNIVDLCPVGALTSKPYAFTARSWELNSKETVDFIDSLSADIKIDLKGNNIMRILPRLNEYINDNWITDLTRYSYDSYKLQRIVKPIYLYKKKYYETNWNNILNLFWKINYINKYILKNKINYSLIGNNLMEANSLISIKELSSFLGTSIIDSRLSFNDKLNTDLRENYLINFHKLELNNSDLLILINLNLRLESPLYNIKIRKLVKKRKIIIISFSQIINLTYYFFHISSNTLSLKKFFEGTNYFCNLFLSFKNPFFILGSNILQRSDNIIKNLFYFREFIKKPFKFGVLQTNITNITGSELGISPNLNYFNDKTLNYKNIYLNSLNLNFLFNNNNLNEKFNNNNNILVYLGSHNNLTKKITKISFYLPTNFYLEKNNFFLNLEGTSRFLNKILSTNNNYSIDDWRILLTLFYKYNNEEYIIKILNNKNNINLIIMNYLLLNYNKTNNILYYIMNIIIKIIFKNKIRYYLHYYILISKKIYYNTFFYSFNKTFLFENNIPILFLNNYNLIINKTNKLLQNKINYTSQLLKKYNKNMILLEKKPYINWYNLQNNNNISVIKNYPFISLYNNYYKSNSLSKLSLFLTKASKQFNSISSNYL